MQGDFNDVHDDLLMSVADYFPWKVAKAQKVSKCCFASVFSPNLCSHTAF